MEIDIQHRFLCKGSDINGQEIKEGDWIRVYWGRVMPCVDKVFDKPSLHKVARDETYGKGLKSLVLYRDGGPIMLCSLVMGSNKPEVILRREVNVPFLQ